MKKNIILLIAMVVTLACMLVISVSAAEPSYADGEWIYAADGVTKLTLRDTDGNPLIWYMNGEELKCVRADQTDESLDVYVKYNIGAGGSGFNKEVFNPQKTLKAITIYDNGTEIICSGSNLSAQKAVLMNLEKLDIDAFNGWLFGNKNGCCPLLRGIYLPSTLKGIGQEGFTNTKLVQIWNIENTQLFYLNACNFAATQTLTQEATGGVFKSPASMTVPLNIQGSKVVTYIMSPNLDYPDMTKPFQQYFRDCSKLQNIFVPASASVGFGEETFRSTPAQYIVYITGTEQDAIDMRDNTKDRSAADNARFKGATVISYETYMLDKKTYDDSTNKVYIVYGYDYCEAFFDGHVMSENTEMKLTSYFEPIKFASVCTNDGCDHAGYDESKTIGAIFVDYGYSITETEIGGKLSMSQFFGINADNLDKYTYLTGNSFEYGFVVSANADPMSEKNSGLIAEGKTYVTEQGKIKYDYFAVTVVGFTESNVDSDIAFCVYVKDGKDVSYLDNGATVSAVEMKSYNDIKALLKNNTEII